MKVSNSKTPANANDGVSRETLNKWQREDSSKPGKEHGPAKEGIRRMSENKPRVEAYSSPYLAHSLAARGIYVSLGRLSR
jgi:hypothetical protein